MINKNKTCCFFGHRNTEKTEELKITLCKIIEDLITSKSIDTFLFGSKSKFDDLCHEVVSEFKNKYPHIKRIYVRAEFPYIDDNYKKYLLQSYDDTYYPEKITNAGKAAYVERNYEMIDKSKYCVVYHNDNYVPPKRNTGNKNAVDRTPKSGTKIACKYALKNGSKIFNTFNV